MYRTVVLRRVRIDIVCRDIYRTVVLRRVRIDIVCRDMLPKREKKLRILDFP